jgi:hypothetical protein
MSVKCPVVIDDLVLMYGCCMEGLYGSNKTDGVTFDFFGFAIS